MALYDKTLYPDYGIQQLSHHRGERWGRLIRYISGLDRTNEHVVAFTYMLRTLRRQLGLDPALCRDPFSTLDAIEVLSHFGGDEADLMSLYYESLEKVRQSLDGISLKPRMQTRTSRAKRDA